MIADRNKSILTHKITDAVCAWLDCHGFKPVETEVDMPWSTNPGARGWVADVAAVIVPTQTELIEMKLIARRPRWSCKGGERNPHFKDQHAEWLKQLERFNRRMTVLVEVKASRGDFLGDRKWKLVPPTDLAFVAVPAGMVKEKEWPEGWGVFELYGDKLRKVRSPEPRRASVEEHLSVIYSVAICRDHRTRYAQHRAWQKEYRIQDAEAREERLVQNVMAAVEGIMSGKQRFSGRPFKSLAEVTSCYQLEKLRTSHREILERFYEFVTSKNGVGENTNATEESDSMRV